MYVYIRIYMHSQMFSYVYLYYGYEGQDGWRHASVDVAVRGRCFLISRLRPGQGLSLLLVSLGQSPVVKEEWEVSMYRA